MKLRSKKKEPKISIDELLPSFNSNGFQQEKIQDWSENTESLLFTNVTREIINKAVGLYSLSKNFAGYGAPHLEFQFDSKYPGKG